MPKPAIILISAILMIAPSVAIAAQHAQAASPSLTGASESAPQREARMRWWREARFGMFIHWGLYAIPAGAWSGATHHGEWILDTAKIPIDQYEQLREQFNPVKFDANAWASIAREAGCKYIVITTKHHDGFCLFDSKHTDWDVMSTPFKRDIMRELADATRRAGLQIGWYHSIMDWHHPDYLPRRPWEKRLPAGADFSRYVAHMKNQLRELLSNYGPIGVVWFDGQWEGTWTNELGVDVARLVRELQPGTIINSRVGKFGGFYGFDSQHAGIVDYGTPEQEIPDAAPAGADWETCMTMNGHWGYNAADKDFKSTSDLIRKLVDIASKGGNFLLNVGPTAAGEIPPESVERLKEIGAWMRANGESIYATQAGPLLRPAWGRCTQKPLDGGGVRLFLHVFEWPTNGALRLDGLMNEDVAACFFLADSGRKPLTTRFESAQRVIEIAGAPHDPFDTVIVLDLKQEADVSVAPTIAAPTSMFIDSLTVSLSTTQQNVELRATRNGVDPGPGSELVTGPIQLHDSTSLVVRGFRNGKAITPPARATFHKVEPLAAIAQPADPTPGLHYQCFEGNFERVPDFSRMTPKNEGQCRNFDRKLATRDEQFALRFDGYIRIPRDDVYVFTLASDDGSKLFLRNDLLIDHDGLHSLVDKSAEIALAQGFHPIQVHFFEATGGDELRLSYRTASQPDAPIGDDMLFRTAEPAWGQAASGGPDEPPMALPAPRQLTWQALEVQAFVHFGVNTFTDREWGEGTESPEAFNPTELDARQWVRAFQTAGMKQVILTAKHHDGFCLWPSKFTEHSVKRSPWRGGKGDVVREVAEACREAKLKFGIYLSPWDRHEPCYGDSPRYNEHYKNQLRELLTEYGPVHEVWFDGACGEGPNGKRQQYDWPGFIAVVRECAPDAVIFSDAGPDVRWVGNEQGYAGETNWSALNRELFYPGTPEFRQLTSGHERGSHWVPAECDVSIRPGWFYHAAEDSKIKSLRELLEIYYNSVGRNSVLLLNVPPDKRGLIHESDAARLRELGETLRETFSKNLAANCEALAEVAPGKSPTAAHLTDGDPYTAWSPAGSGDGSTIRIELRGETTFDRIVLREDIRAGQRVSRFRVAVHGEQGRSILCEGTTIGNKRILRVPPTNAREIELQILNSVARPRISELELYKSSPREAAAGE
ncbi:MAG: alpha-L-fucosidase [Phycisphaerales bacterium]|nr:alpha-L-fucosidase [Phycisphaerales bacterium]